MGVVNYTIFTICTELSNNSNTILFVVSSLYYLRLYKYATDFFLFFVFDIFTFFIVSFLFLRGRM